MFIVVSLMIDGFTKKPKLVEGVFTVVLME
jgi:hypothetical protein